MEFDAMRRRLAEVAAEHLPPPASGRERDVVPGVLALELWAARRSGEASGPVYTGRVSVAKRRERERLDRFRRSVIAAARAFDDLEGHVQDIMLNLDARQPEAEIMTALADVLHAERKGGDYLRKYLDAAEEFIDGADDLRRIRHPAAEVVRIARDWWAFATGKPAPRRGLNPGSGFGEFLADVLKATGVDANPRCAFDAWAGAAGAYADPAAEEADPPAEEPDESGAWGAEVFRRAGIKMRKIQS